MGLDQYAYSIPSGIELYGEKSDDRRKQIGTWRKHNRLQGYMEQLAIDKGIIKEGDVFNTTPVKLSLKDIDDLEHSIQNRLLPETGGFFFGIDSYESEGEWSYENLDLPKDMSFIEKAREALNAGYDVYYDCWW